MGFGALMLFASKSSNGDIGMVIMLIAVVAGVALYIFAKGRGFSEGVRYGRDSEALRLAGERGALEERLRKVTAAELDAAARLEERSRKISESEAEVSSKLDQAIKMKLAADEYASSMRRQAMDTLHRAKEQAKNAYVLQEEELRLIERSCTSSHPNNAYIAEVWNGTYEAIVHDIVHDLEWRAEKTAERIERKFNSSARQWQYESKYYKLQTLLYESLFPELLDYATDESDHRLSPAAPEKSAEEDWLSDEEWDRLCSTKKSQLALDRYIASHKSKWQIGRDYELFVGHCYRRKGFAVEYVGMQMRLADMGRDLICHSNPLSSTVETLIVQCKYWSQNKKIHEKHITQLFGTAVEYAIAHKIELANGRIPPCLKAVIVTSTELSTTARRFADALGVEYHENIQLPEKADSFPRIKCKKSSGIFHLPFDEQYDVTRIVYSEGDCFALTVAEAEAKGFRRAMRYYVRSRRSSQPSTV